MQLVESLPTYGVHYYELKDKTGIPWWLGLSYKGIGQYDITDRLIPRKVGIMLWKLTVFLLLHNREIMTCKSTVPF